MRFLLYTLLCVFLSGCTSQAPAPLDARDSGSAESQTVRCAVIGGMVDTGFWQDLSQRFEKATGHKVEVVARGPKRELLVEFSDGKADLITMHSCDALINLVADGYAENAQPWVRNDFLLVGPAADPAQIKGMTDAVQAVAKIIAGEHKVFIHGSQGVQEVLHDLLEAGGLELDPQHTIVRVEDKQRQMLLVAGQEKAYTLIGRIPYLNGKIPKQDLAIMVQGDPRLRRPYLVATANPARFPNARAVAARQLAEYLRHPDTQAWIANFGRGQLDGEPLFFSVSVGK